MEFWNEFYRTGKKEGRKNTNFLKAVFRVKYGNPGRGAYYWMCKQWGGIKNPLSFS